jgi:hypothetical protein
MRDTYDFATTCVNSTADLIIDMVDRAREVTWRTFARHVPRHELRAFFPGPPALERDYHVRFYSSRFKGRRCYFLVHSAIEYVWTESEAHAA